MYGDTKLTKTAKQLGVKTINAKEMLLYQGLKQFKIFTGKMPSEAKIRKALGILN